MTPAHLTRRGFHSTRNQRHWFEISWMSSAPRQRFSAMPDARRRLTTCTWTAPAESSGVFADIYTQDAWIYGADWHIVAGRPEESRSMPASETTGFRFQKIPRSHVSTGDINPLCLALSSQGLSLSISESTKGPRTHDCLMSPELGPCALS